MKKITFLIATAIILIATSCKDTNTTNTTKKGPIGEVTIYNMNGTDTTFAVSDYSFYSNSDVFVYWTMSGEEHMTTRKYDIKLY